ncbi:UNVERIFIED_CONTAM: hypothetical protein HDU68_009607 [Siphonaria sp. JEL0065]|nr:hypothetical protein HDU68_009607 [Siphonaria sp. JEL0065]
MITEIDEAAVPLLTATSNTNTNGESDVQQETDANAGNDASDNLPSQTPFRRHHLLPDVDLGEGPSRHFDGDDDWDDLYALIPVVIILLGIVLIAFLLWPMIAYDGSEIAVVGGGQSHLLTIETADFASVAVEASLLAGVPVIGNYIAGLADTALRLQNRDLAASRNSNSLAAFTHVFYNTPPVAIPSGSILNRTLEMELSNKAREDTFSALRWEVIEGGSITVNWNFEGGRPDFWVLRSKAAFDLWRQDAFPPLNYQIHHEYSTNNGSYTLSNQPTDLYYFIFSAPAYFWPSFDATGTANFHLQLMEYDLTGTNPKHPQPVVSCETSFEVLQQTTEHRLENPPKLPSPLSKLMFLFSTTFNSIIGATAVPSNDTPIDPSKNKRLWSTTTHTTATPSCQIITPSPQFIKQIHILLYSPPSLATIFGGPGHGNNHTENESYSDDAGTLDNRTTLFSISPRFRNGIGPSPIIFFVWAFCAVIGLSVAVAIGIFVVVYVLGIVVVWVRRFFGCESGSSGSDSEDEGPEPLPLYRPPGEGQVVSGDDGFDRRPPEYSPLDPLVIVPYGDVILGGESVVEVEDDGEEVVFDEERRDSLRNGGAEEVEQDGNESDQLWVDEDERLSPGDQENGITGDEECDQDN